MTWREIVSNPSLRNLPFKVETIRFGQILLSPTTNRQGALRFRVANEIRRCKRSGDVTLNCSVNTSDGVKIVDAAWFSRTFMTEFGQQTPFPKAPEICVEVISPRNSKQEIEHKVELYLAKGALEVWVVNDEKEVAIYTHTGKLKTSKLAPKFKL
jgi:Uma2 family endonuclease